LKNGDASEKVIFNTSLSNEKTINLVAEKKIQETRPQRTEKVAVLVQQREDKIAVKACCTFKTKRLKNKFGRSEF